MINESGSGRSSVWIKARRSTDGGNCVEMRRLGAEVQVRDSKRPDGGLLAIAPAQFTAWVDAARRGEFPAAR
jgi:hypothetical protein